MKKLLLVAASLLLSTSALGAAPVCDRDCLKSTITQYLDAMLRHDPSKLPLASKVRFTEDTQELKLGEGLWKDIDSLTDFRQDVLDVKQGVAAVHVKAIDEWQAGAGRDPHPDGWQEDRWRREHGGAFA